MISARSVTLTTIPQSVSQLIPGIDDAPIRGVVLRPNGAAANYGGRDAQPMLLADGATSDVLPVTNAADLYLTGSSACAIVVFYA